MGNILHIQNGAKICLPPPGDKADTIRRKCCSQHSRRESGNFFVYFLFLGSQEYEFFFFFKCMPLRVADFRFDAAIIT